MQDETRTALEARLSELQAEREQYRIIAGKKAERFTGEGSQLTLQVLGQVLTTVTAGGRRGALERRGCQLRRTRAS